MNEAQPDGTRPIHWAVYKVDYELLDALIAKKAKVDVTNEFGATPLAEAVKLADARMVKTLLDAGAGVEGANLDGETALMLAIKTGELPIVEMLIKAGANVNTVEKYHNQTPLMWAAAAPKNAGEMVKLLLSKGADVKPRALYTTGRARFPRSPARQYRPVGGLTALLYAARDGCYDCVEALIGAGADVNVPTPEGVTPLMIALDNDHNDVAKLLLDRGANPQVWDWWGRTALYIAIDRKESVGGGARWSGGRGGGGRGAAAASRGSGPAVSSMDIINRLLAADVDPNPELNMHRPSRGGNSGRFADRPIEHGMHAFVSRDRGRRHGSDSSSSGQGRQPQHQRHGCHAIPGRGRRYSGWRGRRRCAEYHASGSDAPARRRCECSGHRHEDLLHADRLQSSSDKEGMSALHVAAQAGRTDLVRYLLEKGANPEIADANGRKPIDLVGAGGDGGGRGRGGAPAPGAAAATCGARSRCCFRRGSRRSWRRWGWRRQPGDCSRDSRDAARRGVEEVVNRLVVGISSNSAAAVFIWRAARRIRPRRR